MLLRNLWTIAAIGGVSFSSAILQAQGPPPAPATPQALGRQTFLSRCAPCHGTTGNGGEFAPGIATRIPLRSDDDL